MNQTSFTPDWVTAYVAEVEVASNELNVDLRELAPGDGHEGKLRVPVAAMILEAKSSDYLRDVLPEQDDRDPFVFLSYLLSDRRTAALNRGAGAVLIAHAKEVTRQLGLDRICSDCWRGNNRKLVK